MQAPLIAFEVLDALGLVRLEKRGGDLGGSVPLRVAQGCAPLLEGNAFGFQIALLQAVTLRRVAGRLDAEMAPPFGEALMASHRAVLPRLVAQGLIRPDDAFLSTFADGFVVADGACGVRLWTGLLVRPERGIWLRASAAGNRRNRHIAVDEQIIPDSGMVPLVLTLRLRPGAPDRVILDGEVGTIAPLAPGARIDDVPLAQAPEIGVAHAAFYDQAYFDTKSAGITRKYRKMKPLPDGPPGPSRVVNLGPPGHAIGGAVARVTFTNLVPFEARYDGYGVTLDPDQGALREGARAVERAFAEALGPTFLGDNPRAVLYFTKYFTPHPPGEPHFFLKPWTFLQTPPGWSCLLEGVQGDGYDVMRGVVATDIFHATPVVFHLFRTGEPIRVELGAPLLHAIPIPRQLLQAGYREITLAA